METLWYVILISVFTVYVVLDGYDIGVAMLVPFVATTESERGMVRGTIGPVWTGNEVWLIAGSALLFSAFPKAYAAGFSGFYLALMILLWLLIGRGLAFELRGHVEHLLWRTGWDAIFSVSGLLLAFLLGLLVGNVSRGVPLNAEGYFFLPLWTDARPGAHPGMLDWFTLLSGLTMVLLLALHGATYLAMKTIGPLREKCRSVVGTVSALAAVSLSALYGAWPFVQPAVRENYVTNPAGYVWPATSVAALVLVLLCHVRDRQVAAFVSSCLLIASFLVTLAWGTYPNLLMAIDPGNSVTIAGAAAERGALQVALWWVLPGLTLVMFYQWLIRRLFAGPVASASHHSHGA